MRRHKAALLAAMLLLAVLSGCGTNRDTLRVTIPQIGKADCGILKVGSDALVIDCGESENAQEILNTLQEQGISSLRYLIITHFDKDHVGGASLLLHSVSVEQVLEPSYTPENPQAEAYAAYRKALEETGVPVNRVTDSVEFTLGTAEITVFGTGGKTYSKNIDNNNSLLVSVSHAGNRLLFAGDIEKQRIQDLPEACISGYDFLKVPHHGRYNASLPAFFETVGMKYAVITCSEKNPADQDTLDALNQAGAEVYKTADGSITVLSTKNGIQVRQ